VLVRTGQTEGSVDLARMAGLEPAGVICEIMNPDGSMARRDDLRRFARRHGLVLLSVADLIRYRLESEHLVRRLEEVRMPLSGLGDFVAVRYLAQVDGRQHVAFVKGRVADGAPVLVRMHSACPLGDTGLYAGCDCGAQLRRSLEQISREGRGVLVYLQKGSPARLGCIHTAAEESGRATRLREFGVGAQILRDLGIARIRLLTNNPKKIVGVQGYGLSVVERVPIEVEPTPENRAYLRRKRALGHLLARASRAPRRARKSNA
jgi:3,4-dihydroxy 2-butanone 4-phosphate synthase/GTP cyclohydrolase II